MVVSLYICLNDNEEVVVMPVNYEIVKKIFSFPYGKGNGEIQLNLIKWGDNPAKLDLRK